MKMAVAAAIAASTVYSYFGLGLGWHGTTPARRALGRAWAWPEARWAGTARHGGVTGPSRHGTMRPEARWAWAGPARHGPMPSSRQHHDVQDHRRHHYAGQEQQRVAAAAVFHVSTPTDPIATLIAAPLVHQGSVVLRSAEPYDHGASYHHLEDERPHQPRKFDGRSTSGLDEVIRGCTSRRSNGGETSGGKDGAEWQYPSFWPSDSQDHHG